MQTPPPAHLPKFKDWIVKRDGKAAGTASIYARFLTRCAEHYGTTINEQTVRTDADVQKIISQVSKVVAVRDRWAKGTFNTYDVTRNLIFALQAYSRFSREAFTGVIPRSAGGTSAYAPPPAQASKPIPQTESPAMTDTIALDVPRDELPERLRMEVSRLVRETKLAQEVKAAHAHTCQVCGLQLQLKPGQFYSEGHHLKPLGNPHNGPDVKDNILCVCPNCHAKLDFRAIKIEAKKLKVSPGHSVRQEFIDYHNNCCS